MVDFTQKDYVAQRFSLMGELLLIKKKYQV
jgi:hypothetical protein